MESGTLTLLAVIVFAVFVYLGMVFSRYLKHKKAVSLTVAELKEEFDDTEWIKDVIHDYPYMSEHGLLDTFNESGKQDWVKIWNTYQKHLKATK